MWDLERLDNPVYEAQAHANIVNAIDSCGGQVCLSQDYQARILQCGTKRHRFSVTMRRV